MENLNIKIKFFFTCTLQTSFIQHIFDSLLCARLQGYGDEPDQPRPWPRPRCAQWYLGPPVLQQNVRDGVSPCGKFQNLWASLPSQELTSALVLKIISAINQCSFLHSIWKCPNDIFKYPQRANKFFMWKRINTLVSLLSNVKNCTLMLEMVM